MPDIPSKFQKDPSITFRVILLTHRQTDKQTNKDRQKHYLLGGGNQSQHICIVTYVTMVLACTMVRRRPLCQANHGGKCLLDKKPEKDRERDRSMLSPQGSKTAWKREKKIYCTSQKRCIMADSKLSIYVSKGAMSKSAVFEQHLKVLDKFGRSTVCYRTVSPKQKERFY